MPTAHCLIASGAITTTSTRRSGMSLQLWRRILAAGAGLAARENHAPGKLSLGHVACTSGQCFCFCRVSPLLPFPRLLWQAPLLPRPALLAARPLTALLCAACETPAVQDVDRAESCVTT